jgi:hypothetical protein
MGSICLKQRRDGDGERYEKRYLTSKPVKSQWYERFLNDISETRQSNLYQENHCSHKLFEDDWEMVMKNKH